MKHTLILISLLLTSLISLSGCQKSPVNGDLDGMWHIISIDPAPDVDGPFDSSQLYYNFSLEICQLSIYGGPWINGLMNYSEDTIALDFSSSKVPDQSIKLKQYGINSDKVVFHIEELNSKHLIINNENTTITMRKF